MIGWWGVFLKRFFLMEWNICILVMTVKRARKWVSKQGV